MVGCEHASGGIEALEGSGNEGHYNGSLRLLFKSAFAPSMDPRTVTYRNMCSIVEIP
jgi:hypothetical protein